jgi:SET domain-containing protein
MVEEDKERWLEFTNRPNELNRDQIKLVAELHAKYYNHKYDEPCTCNGSIYRRWIEDLNKLI